MKDYTLGNIDIQKIGTGLLVAEGGAILTTALVWLQSGKTDWKELLILEEAVVLSTLINTLRKVLDGETQ